VTVRNGEVPPHSDVEILVRTDSTLTVAAPYVLNGSTSMRTIDVIPEAILNSVILQYHVTEREAVKAAIMSSFQKSRNEKVEYGGVIYRVGPGSYGFTVKRGQKDTIKNLPLGPIGSETVALWHTHHKEDATFSAQDALAAVEFKQFNHYLGFPTSPTKMVIKRLDLSEKDTKKMIKTVVDDVVIATMSNYIDLSAVRHYVPVPETGQVIPVKLNSAGFYITAMFSGVSITASYNLNTTSGLMEYSSISGSAGPLSINSKGDVGFKFSATPGVFNAGMQWSLNPGNVARNLRTYGLSGLGNSDNYSTKLTFGPAIGAEAFGYGYGIKWGMSYTTAGFQSVIPGIYWAGGYGGTAGVYTPNPKYLAGGPDLSYNPSKYQSIVDQYTSTTWGTSYTNSYSPPKHYSIPDYTYEPLVIVRDTQPSWIQQEYAWDKLVPDLPTIWDDAALWTPVNW
jgi:hypothetical protein